jgi:hypothetical protein
MIYIFVDVNNLVAPEDCYSAYNVIVYSDKNICDEV